MARRVAAELFFDVVSPYTYLHMGTLSQYARLWPCAVKMRPMFLGGVMMAAKNQPPATVKAKGRWLGGDLARSADLAGLPILKTPTNFFSEVAKQVLGVQRLLCAAELHGMSQEHQLELASAFAHSMHADGSLRSGDNELKVNEALFEAAFGLAGVDPADAKALVEASTGQAAKDLLKANTEEAVARGTFGSPTTFVTSSGGGKPDVVEFMVFGSDRMEQVAHACGMPYHGTNPKVSAPAAWEPADKVVGSSQ